MKNYDSIVSDQKAFRQKKLSFHFFDRFYNIMLFKKTIEQQRIKKTVQTLVLFQGYPNQDLVASLLKAHLSIGVLLSSNEFKADPSLSNYDYAFIGTEGDKKPSYSCAIKELTLKGWQVVDPAKAKAPHIENENLAIIINNASPSLNS